MTDEELAAAAEQYQVEYFTSDRPKTYDEIRNAYLAGAQRMRESCAGEIERMSEMVRTAHIPLERANEQLTAASARIEKLRAALERVKHERLFGHENQIKPIIDAALAADRGEEK